MLCGKERLFMSVQLRRKAELFYIALGDVWSAEQLQYGNPNNAVWHCTQAAEKTMKGYLYCLNKEYGHDHNLDELIESINDLIKLPTEINDYIIDLNRYSSKLRYRSMKTDPTTEDAKVAISRTKQIMDAFSKIPDISNYVTEAKEVHAKILKSIADEESQPDKPTS